MSVEVDLPQVIHHKSLEKAPYSVEFDRERYALLLGEMGMEQEDISSLVVTFKRKPPLHLFVANGLTKSSGQIEIYTDRLQNEANSATNVLIHESQHAVDYKNSPKVVRLSKGVSYSVLGGYTAISAGSLISGVVSPLDSAALSVGLVMPAIYLIQKFNVMERRAREAEEIYGNNPQYENMVSIIARE